MMSAAQRAAWKAERKAKAQERRAHVTPPTPGRDVTGQILATEADRPVSHQRALRMIADALRDGAFMAPRNTSWAGEWSR